MTKYEIRTDRFEFSNSKKSWTSQTADDIINLYHNPYECNSPKLEASFESLEEAKAEFESHYRNYGNTREMTGWAGTHLLVGEIAFLEENEYDEDGEFDQGGNWINWSVEPYNNSALEED